MESSVSHTKNPYYHTAGDTLATLNLAFHAEVTRGLVAALATLSEQP